MQPLPVVIPIDECLQVLAQIVVIFVLSAVDLFSFESLDKAFTTGVVPGISRPTHTGNDAMGLEQIRVVPTGVLHSPIGMVYQPGLRST
jgi:hypothetical protein